MEEMTDLCHTGVNFRTSYFSFRHKAFLSALSLQLIKHEFYFWLLSRIWKIRESVIFIFPTSKSLMIYEIYVQLNTSKNMGGVTLHLPTLKYVLEHKAARKEIMCEFWLTCGIVWGWHCGLRYKMIRKIWLK